MKENTAATPAKKAPRKSAPRKKPVPASAVGEVAEQNLRELGHITLRFDGQPQAEYPGTVHVAGPVPQAVTPGCTLKFVA